MLPQVMKNASEAISDELALLLQRYPQLLPVRAAVSEAASTLARAFAAGHKLLVAGNGGSAADADHIVGELMKGFMRKRTIAYALQQKLRAAHDDLAEFYIEHLQQGLPAIALTVHSSLISAYHNDCHPDLVYAQQVLGYGEPGDIFLGISTSGNAKNVLHALNIARAKGLITLGLTGETGGALAQNAHIAICVPARSTADVQELHLPVYHCWCKIVETIFFAA